MYNWNILDDMFSMKNLMERAFGELSSGSFSGGTPAINVYETDTASEIKALVPGLTRDEIEITFEKGLLTIATRERKDDQKPDGTVIREECCRSQFRRSVRFAREIERGERSGDVGDFRPAAARRIASLLTDAGLRDAVEVPTSQPFVTGIVTARRPA